MDAMASDAMNTDAMGPYPHQSERIGAKPKPHPGANFQHSDANTIRESILGTMLSPHSNKNHQQPKKVRHPKPSWTPLWTP